jgi:hypothetical protein
MTWSRNRSNPSSTSPRRYATVLDPPDRPRLVIIVISTVHPNALQLLFRTFGRYPAVLARYALVYWNSSLPHCPPTSKAVATSRVSISTNSNLTISNPWTGGLLTRPAAVHRWRPDGPHNCVGKRATMIMDHRLHAGWKSCSAAIGSLTPVRGGRVYISGPPGRKSIVSNDSQYTCETQ